jgi:L-malate glycosyltransferase
MSYAIPVIGLNDSGTSEIIEDMVTGILFEYDYKDLSKKMLMLMEDKELYNKISLGGWKHAKNKFGLESYTTIIYKECISPLIEK